MPLLALICLFVFVPLAELALLIRVNEAIQLGWTLALVVGTGVLGAWLARWQGVRQIALIQQQLGQGTMPAPELLDGLLILLAGAVLLTPGLITDTLGFYLLLPPGRASVRAWLRRWLEGKLRHGVVDVTHWEW